MNEDKRKEQTASLKGGSKVQADAIKEKYMSKLQQRQERMAKEAEMRQIQRQQYEKDLEKEKEELKARKQKLKEIQDKDIMMKK